MSLLCPEILTDSQTPITWIQPVFPAHPSQLKRHQPSILATLGHSEFRCCVLSDHHTLEHAPASVRNALFLMFHRTFLILNPMWSPLDLSPPFSLAEVAISLWPTAHCLALICKLLEGQYHLLITLLLPILWPSSLENKRINKHVFM